MAKTKVDTNDKKSEEKKPIKKTKSESKPARKSWDDRFEECLAFSKKSGRCKIPTAYKENHCLGVWVQEQRRNFKLLKQGKKPRAELTDEQIVKLDEIGFHWGFTPDPNSAESDASWEANLLKLKEYKESNGDFDVPMEGSSLELAKWTRAQRNQYKKRANKVKTFMTKERVKTLEGIGFDWGGVRD
jgi:Helicase associated domain